VVPEHDPEAEDVARKAWPAKLALPALCSTSTIDIPDVLGVSDSETEDMGQVEDGTVSLTW
jgi:hypothetical protein